MWGLVAAAAAGLDTGAGLQYALSTPANNNVSMPETWTSYKEKISPKLTLSSSLMALSSGAAIAAYYAGGDNRDPAWLTCGLIAGAVPLYNLLVMAPTASVIESPVIDTESVQHRATWMDSFTKKSYVATGLAAVAFGSMLLVLNAGNDGGDLSSSNPLRGFGSGSSK